MSTVGRRSSAAGVGGDGQQATVRPFNPGPRLQAGGLGAGRPTQRTQMGQGLAGLQGTQRQRACHAAQQRACDWRAVTAGVHLLDQGQPGGTARWQGGAWAGLQRELHAEVALPGRAGACLDPQARQRRRCGVRQLQGLRGARQGQTQPCQPVCRLGQGASGQRRAVGAGRDPVKTPGGRARFGYAGCNRRNLRGRRRPAIGAIGRKQPLQRGGLGGWAGIACCWDCRLCGASAVADRRHNQWQGNGAQPAAGF